MDPNEEHGDLVGPPPVMLGVESGTVSTFVADANEVTGGFQPIPVPGQPPNDLIDTSEPNPEFFRAFCEAIHPPGTPGCAAEGGPWAGDLTTDVETARGQMRGHNESFDLEPHHFPTQAFVAVRFRATSTFIPQPLIV